MPKKRHNDQPESEWPSPLRISFLLIRSLQRSFHRTVYGFCQLRRHCIAYLFPHLASPEAESHRESLQARKLSVGEASSARWMIILAAATGYRSCLSVGVEGSSVSRATLQRALDIMIGGSPRNSRNDLVNRHVVPESRTRKPMRCFRKGRECLPRTIKAIRSSKQERRDIYLPRCDDYQPPP